MSPLIVLLLIGAVLALALGVWRDEVDDKRDHAAEHRCEPDVDEWETRR